MLLSAGEKNNFCFVSLYKNGGGENPYLGYL